MKAATCCSEKSLLISFPTTATRFFQLSTYPTTGEVSHQNLLTIRIQCSALSKLNNFSLCRKRCATMIKPKSLPMIHQSLQFILSCVQKMIFYQTVVRSSVRLLPFPSMTLCTSLMIRTSWAISILVVVLLSTLKLQLKSDGSTENRNTFPDPVKNPSAFPATINITVLLISSIALVSFWTRIIHGTWFQQLLCHSTTLMIDTLGPISSLNQQFTNLEQTHIRCSLHSERGTVKGRIARQLCILSNKLPTGWMNERNSCHRWRVEWSLETRSNEWNSVICDEL